MIALWILSWVLFLQKPCRQDVVKLGWCLSVFYQQSSSFREGCYSLFQISKTFQIYFCSLPQYMEVVDCFVVFKRFLLLYSTSDAIVAL